MMKRVLVLFVHPALRRSRVNRALRDALTGLEGVEVHDLYETYPDFTIDVAAEQERVSAQDILVFQHPVYWYAGPALLKEWFDLVLEHGFAFGPGGEALAGKGWLSAVSTGGDAESYQASGPHGCTLSDVLRPYAATAALCRMRWLSPFVTHDALALGSAGLQAAAAAYRQRIAGLRDGLEEN